MFGRRLRGRDRARARRRSSSRPSCATRIGAGCARAVETGRVVDHRAPGRAHRAARRRQRVPRRGDDLAPDWRRAGDVRRPRARHHRATCRARPSHAASPRWSSPRRTRSSRCGSTGSSRAGTRAPSASTATARRGDRRHVGELILAAGSPARSSAARSSDLPERPGRSASRSRHMRRDGSEFPVEATVSVITDAAGALAGHVADRARHHRAPRARGAAAPGAEDGGDRPARGRHRARLQQPADGDRRLRPARLARGSATVRARPS